MSPALATFAILVLEAILMTLGETLDVPRPTEGYQLCANTTSSEIIMPLSIAQCEHVLIYYNNTRPHELNVGLIGSASDFPLIVNIYLPPGIGYLDWICDIPARSVFIAFGYGYEQLYTVQPGSSSACLSNITTTYSYATYFTTFFQSYTRSIHSVPPPSSFGLAPQASTIAFPTSSYPTITANPDLDVSTITTSPLSSQTSSGFSHKSNSAVITGSAIGGVVLFLLAVTLLLAFLRKRRNSASCAESKFGASSASMSRLGPTYQSTLVLLSPDQERLFSRTDSMDMVHHDAQSTSNVNVETTWRDDVPDATPYGSSTPTAPLAPPKTDHPISSYQPHEPSTSKSRNTEANPIAALDVTQLTASERQALITHLNASTDPPTSPTTLPQLSTDEVPEHLSEIATNILGFISRSQLSPRERQALGVSLHNLLVPNQTEDSTLPPPYAG